MSIPIVFFGTPQFAVPTLEALIESPEIEVKGVLTQPDRPAGRGKKIKYPPVKQLALDQDIDILQPNSLKEPVVLEWLQKYNPKAIVVVAYGGFVQKAVREFTPYGCINLHPSLLPKYRGAAPIHWPILNGDKKTGNTTMYIAKGWDNGDMIYQEEEPIYDSDTYGTLADRLAQKGANLMLKTIIDVDQGIAPRIPQSEEDVVFAPMIKNEDAKVDWNKPADVIFNHIRGMNPIPGAYTLYKDQRWKLLKSRIIPIKPNEPGTLHSTEFNTIRISASDAVIEILEIQPSGKKTMSAAEFLRGHPLEVGSQCQ